MSIEDENIVFEEVKQFLSENESASRLTINNKENQLKRWEL
jgi:hypothetical protein